VKVGSVILDECSRCGGLWVDASSFHRICQETEEQTMVLQATSSSSARPSETAPAQRYWPCPECRRLMNRQNFARVSGIIVDVCKGHGVWFNQGELRRIVEFIREGGMSRARERERADLEDERARLRAAARDVQAAAARTGAWSSGSEARTSDVEILSAVRGLLDWIS
jgi:Zn-finger nucleic acid-binding protein